MKCPSNYRASTNTTTTNLSEDATNTSSSDSMLEPRLSTIQRRRVALKSYEPSFTCIASFSAAAFEVKKFDYYCRLHEKNLAKQNT